MMLISDLLSLPLGEGSKKDPCFLLYYGVTEGEEIPQLSFPSVGLNVRWLSVMMREDRFSSSVRLSVTDEHAKSTGRAP